MHREVQVLPFSTDPIGPTGTTGGSRESRRFRAKKEPDTVGCLAICCICICLSLVGAAWPADAATFVVMDIDPEGPFGVFEAVTGANFEPGPDEIVFNIGSQTIQMTSPLMLTDATTVRAIGGMPVLDGSGAPSTTRGFVLAGDNSSIKGIAIRNYPNVGIEIRGSFDFVSGCIISGSQFGVSVTLGATDNLIGGNPEDRNFIYDNTFGVSSDLGAIGTRVLNNVIGISEASVVSPNLVGVDLDGERPEVLKNVISGNTVSGVSIGADFAKVADNIIGLSEDMTTAVPNGMGLIITGDDATVAGEFVDVTLGNVIAGNTGTGIVLGGARADVRGNRIGVNRSVTAAFPNGGDGIAISGASNTIASSDLDGPNRIAGNSGNGIALTSFLATGNKITGNLIGGTFPNGLSGIRATGSGNLIGATTGVAADGNTITANTLNGIEIVGPEAFGNQIDGNQIENNGGSGIRIVDASDNLVGLTVPNEVRGHALNGVDVNSQTEIADRNTIRLNRITDNDGFGIALFGPAQSGIEPPATDFATGGGITGTALPQATVDLYADPFDEAEFFIGTVTADGAGNYTSPGSVALWAGSALNATQTDVNGNTSEFSVPLPIRPGGVSVPPPIVGQTLCMTTLDENQVVPPSGSDASGTATFVVEVVGESVLLNVIHSVQNPTAAEIHLGAPGENGPLVQDLGAPESPVIAALAGVDFRTFTDGNHYVVISNTDNPSGDIRGPVLCPEPEQFVEDLAALLTLAAVAFRLRTGSRATR